MHTEQVLRAATHLTPAEFDDLVMRLLTLRAERAAPHLNAAESALLLQINEGWPATVQQRFDTLIKRRQSGTITADELDELTRLTDESEQRDARRLAALAELAQHRSVTLAELLDTLGITAVPYA